MDKSSISQSNEQITFHISKEDLTYTIQELEKLHEEGGQFSLRIERAFILFQKVKVDKNNKTEIMNTGTVSGFWSSAIFFALFLFCFITVAYGVIKFLS